MRRLWFIVSIFTFLLLTLPLLTTVPAFSQEPSTAAAGGVLATNHYQVTSQTMVVAAGTNPVWSPDNTRFTYDHQAANYYWDLWIANADGGGNTCLTCSTAARSVLGNYNKGNSVWSTDGKFIVFQVQMISACVRPHVEPCGGDDWKDFPGSGYQNDLWATNPNGTTFWRLTNQANWDGNGSGGVIYPTFSWDGTKLTWGQRLTATGRWTSTWELAVATWTVTAGVPSLTNQKNYRPNPAGARHYYEPHGWSRDNSTIFYMGGYGAGGAPTSNNVYSYTIGAPSAVNLTNTPTSWNEWPTPAPFGGVLVYMTMDRTPNESQVRRCTSDLWMMNLDGTEKYPLTHFNDPTHAQYEGAGGMCLSASSWNASGTQILVFNNGYANTHDPRAPQGAIYLLTIKNARSMHPISR